VPQNASSSQTSSTKVVMYTTPWCGYCRILKRHLTTAKIAFEEVDIERHPEFAIRIEEVTGGNRTVPTLKIGDSYLVNPSLEEVQNQIHTTP